MTDRTTPGPVYAWDHFMKHLDVDPVPEGHEVALTAPQAAKAAGITYRQLHHWVTLGLCPGIAPGPGSGNCWTFRHTHLAHLKRMADLVNGCGMSPSRASVIATAIQRNDHAIIGGLVIRPAQE